MTQRSRAREIALQVLYQDDVNPRLNPAVTDAFIQRRLRTDDLRHFARELVAGVRRHRENLDRLIEQTAAHWSLARMAVVDRNVLRLGAFELRYTEMPDRVALDEAIELAKRYGTAQSAPFVNGILDRLVPRGAIAGERGSETEKQASRQT
jgi:transcription antitermination protein NusB